MKTYRHPAFTLVEMLIVVAIVGIMAAVMLPSAEPTVYDNLHAVADIIAADLGYCRSLAVTNNSRYKMTFDVTNNRYTITHSGTNTSLNTLPATPFRATTDTATEQVVNLSSLPRVGIPVKLVSALAMSTVIQNVTWVEFGPLGGTIRPEESVVWLSAGEGKAKHYLSIRVNPVTGLTWIEKYQTTAPPSPPTAAGALR